MRVVASMAVCALALASARAAEIKQITPFTPPQALLDARGTQIEPALEATYRVEESGAAPRTITVDLAQTWCTLVEDDTLTTYDFALRRRLVLNDVSHAFTDTSLFAVVDERLNRQPGGTATFAPSKQALSRDEGKRLGRCLRYIADAPTAIDDEIGASGFLPQRLAFAKTTWTLQSAAQVKAVYPSRPGEKPVPPASLAGDKTLADLLPTLQAAVAGTAPGLRTPSDYRAAVEKALAEGNGFRAMIAGFELHQQYDLELGDCAGASPCHSKHDVIEAANKDPRMAPLMSSLKPPPDKIEAAIATLRGMRRDDLGQAPLLDELTAENLGAAGRCGEAVPIFAVAIRANPYMASYYSALAECYRTGGQRDPALAWMVFDLGRALPGGRGAHGIGDVTEFEDHVAQTYPGYF